MKIIVSRLHCVNICKKMANNPENTLHILNTETRFINLYTMSVNLNFRVRQVHVLELHNQVLPKGILPYVWQPYEICVLQTLRYIKLQLYITHYNIFSY